MDSIDRLFLGLSVAAYALAWYNIATATNLGWALLMGAVYLGCWQYVLRDRESDPEEGWAA